MTAPHRRFTLNIELGADDYRGMLTALENWILMMRLNHPNLDINHHGVTGGPDYGYTYDIVVNPDMDHDKYFEAVNVFLQGKEGKA